MEERRIFKRVDTLLRVRYKVLNRLSLKRESTGRDLSGGGIRLKLKEKLSVDTKLRLEIRMPPEDSRVTIAFGEVVWTKEIEQANRKTTRYYDIGVRFVQVDPITMGKIFNYFSKDQE